MWFKWQNLEFIMMPKWYEFSRILSGTLEFDLFLMLGSDTEPRHSVGHQTLTEGRNHTFQFSGEPQPITDTATRLVGHWEYPCGSPRRDSCSWLWISSSPTVELSSRDCPYSKMHCVVKLWLMVPCVCFRMTFSLQCFQAVVFTGAYSHYK